MSPYLNLRKLAALFITVSAVSTLSGCAGISAPYEHQTIAPDAITLIPVTGELIAQQARAEEEIIPPVWPIKPADYVYRVRPGDLMTIAVPTIVSFNTANAPSFLSDQDQGYLVYNDGTIYLPYSGSVTVSGMTLKEAQERIVKALSGYLRSPQVVVSVKEFRSQRVMITGQVQTPGYVPITDVPMTLIGALSTVGGLVQQRGGTDPRTVGGSTNATTQNPPEFADLSNVLLKRGGQTYTINAKKLLASGDISLDPLLLDGDVVVVPPFSRTNIFMMGEVVRPGLVEVNRGTDLAKLLLSAGGLSQDTANAARVYVIRGDYKKPTVYQVDASRPDAMLLAQKFELQPNDVVFVSESGTSRYNRGLAQVLPTVQGLLSTAIVVNTVNTLGNHN